MYTAPRSNVAPYNKIQSDFVKVCLAIMKSKDTAIYYHSLNVRKLAGKIAAELNLGQDIIEIIDMGCILHDFGKIAMPSHLLTKNGHYDDAEYEAMKQHSYVGCDLLKAFSAYMPDEVSEIIRSHHERNGGTGYPDHLLQLPLYVEIVAVADIVAAMQEHRYHRNGWPLAQSLSEALKYSWSDRISHLLTDSVDLFLLDEDSKRISSRPYENSCNIRR